MKTGKLLGNLIVDVFIEREVTAGNGKKAAAKRRVKLGTLPAIPFETVARNRS